MHNHRREKSHGENIHNHYFLLRHGQSEANRLGLIVSDPALGVANYGLTPQGRSQVASSVQNSKARGLLDASTLIYASDFKRCRETAEIAHAILECAPPAFTPALRERYFGALERTHHENYKKIWSLDEQDPQHKAFGVESVVEVVERTTALIHDLEAHYADASILLVSHGDALQILQTAFNQISPALHRHLLPIGTGEIRQLV